MRSTWNLHFINWSLSLWGSWKPLIDEYEWEVMFLLPSPRTKHPPSMPQPICCFPFLLIKLVSSVHCDALILKDKPIKSNYKQLKCIEIRLLSNLWRTDENEMHAQIAYVNLITAHSTGTTCPFALSMSLSVSVTIL